MESLWNLPVAAVRAIRTAAYESKIDEEHVGNRQETEVWLLTTPLAVGFNTDQESFRHQRLVFFFKQDNSWRTAEGVQGKDDTLQPRYTHGRPEREANEKNYHLGNIQISPQQLKQHVISNEYNGKMYLSTTQNCHDWVRSLCGKLGPEIEKSLQEIGPAPLREQSLGALLWGVAELGVKKYLNHNQSQQ